MQLYILLESVIRFAKKQYNKRNMIGNHYNFRKKPTNVTFVVYLFLRYFLLFTSLLHLALHSITGSFPRR